MPQHKDAKKRRRTFFARIPSTFTNKLSSVCSITDDKKLLHSKSTYFYRWGSRKKLSSKMTFLIPSVCGLALLVGGVVAVNPAVNQEQAYAYDVTSGGAGGGTGTESGDTTPSIALSFPTEGLPEGFNNNAEQTTIARAGEVAYRSNIFDVTINNSDWYAILVRAANGYTNELKNGNAVVTGVGSNVYPDSFKENTWGYALTKETNIADSSLAYNTLAENNDLSPVYNSYLSEASLTERFKLTFAAKLGNDSPSGHYTTKVYLSAVTNPTQLTLLLLNNISTMQEMSKNVCDNTAIGGTTRLRDTRDNNYYWVAKLRDGNCWMTQNLDFDVPQTLRATDTNVASDMTLPTIAAFTNNTSNGIEAWPMGTTTDQQNSGYNTLSYYDPGMMLKTDPATTNGCWSGALHKLNASECTSKGWIDARWYTARTTAPQGDAASNTSAANSVLSGSTYDAHYLSGNYYSWNLATASTGQPAATAANNAQGTQAPGSICPKGWKLPASGQNLSQYPSLLTGSLNSYTNDVSGSFANLFKKYGLATALNSGNVTANGYNIYDAPLYYLRAGTVSEFGGDGALSAGFNGCYWSSVVYNASTAYSFNFGDGTSFSPSSTYTRYVGLSVRCVNDPSI